MLEEAVILSGGFGTRLRDVVQDLPKPMAPVNGKPFLEYLLRYLRRQHVKRAVLSTGYLHEKIEAHFGDAFDGMELVYVVEKEALGTGGGIRLALESCAAKNVYVLNGDTFFDISLDELCSAHWNEQADATIALRAVNDASRYGTVELKPDSAEIAAFREKDPSRSGPALINAGVYVLNREQYLNATPGGKAFSIEQDFFAEQLGALRFCGRPFSEEHYFIDIGIPADYQKANDDLRHFRY